jgi:hypothetical protein
MRASEIRADIMARFKNTPWTSKTGRLIKVGSFRKAGINFLT